MSAQDPGLLLTDITEMEQFPTKSNQSKDILFLLLLFLEELL